MKMRRLTFAFLVTLYVVFTHINCDINSSSSVQFPEKFSLQNLIANRKNFTRIVLNKNETFELLQTALDDTLISGEEKGKLCLKNITECMKNDKSYEETTNRLSNLLFTTLPPFDLTNVQGISLACQKQSGKYINDLKKFKIWALKMYDSTAKIPSGLLNGNVNQLGDFDMCLEANFEQSEIYGQYCLAAIEIQNPNSPYLAGLHRLMQSHFHFKSRLEDPGHRVPRFSSINWALCVPKACSPRDVEIGLKRAVNHVVKDTEVEVRIEVDPTMCQSSIKEPISMSTYVGILFFGITILVVLSATLYSNYSTDDKNEWIEAFSLRKNFNSMISMKRSSSDIEAVHGIRFLNAFMLLFAHKSMALFFIPYANRTEFVEYIGRPFSVIGRAASLYTDPFIMFSGALTAYSLLGKLQRTQKLNVLQEYFSRLLRIVPPFAALIAFCTFILPWINSGPMWNLVITHHSDICKKYWWRNLLFIHNYFGFKDMCLTHTHHIGIDTQLFFVSPFLIYLLWKWPKQGTVVLIGLAIVSTVMRYYVTYTMRLSNYIHFGTSIQQLFDTADNMYILPTHRLTVYIMGIFLGYILRNFKNISLNKTQLRIGNAIALCSFILSFFGPSFMSNIDYVYNPTHAAWYAAFAPILWCFSFAWVIYTTHIGYRGVAGTFFSHPVFTLWTKLSYTVYLTQFPIYFYNVGITRSPENYGFFRMMFNLKEYLWILLLSAILSLLFESPFQNIRNIIFKSKKETTKKMTEFNLDKKIC